jgi:plasmid stabilization system protein ParE
MERCRGFLAPKNPQAAVRAGQAIARHLLPLETTPEMGQPFEDIPPLRELIIGLGDSGYVALHRRDPAVDTVYVLAFRHQKEAGY